LNLVLGVKLVKKLVHERLNGAALITVEKYKFLTKTLIANAQERFKTAIPDKQGFEKCRLATSVPSHEHVEASQVSGRKFLKAAKVLNRDLLNHSVVGILLN